MTAETARTTSRQASTETAHRLLRNAFSFYLALLAVTGAIVVWLATSRMGPGVSTDSAQLMSVAENVARGNGLVTYSGSELTQFPPLYALIMAAGSLVFSQDVFVVGWVLNIVVFAALIWCTGLYFAESFQEEPLLAYLGSFAIWCSASLIQICANVASDPPFILMVVLFLMTATHYLRSGKSGLLILMGILAIVASFQRYAGLALAVAGALVLAYNYRRRPARGGVYAALFCILTGLPIALWGVLHNRAINGTVFGSRLETLPMINLTTGAHKLLYWFIPDSLITRIGVLPLFAITVLILAVLAWIAGSSRFLQRLGSPELAPSVAFLLVYSGVLVFGTSSFELRGVTTDRIHIAAFPSVLMVLLAIGVYVLENARQRMGTALIYVVATVLFLAWASYPVKKSTDYVRSSMLRGDTSGYNSINKNNIRTSPLANYLKTLDVRGQATYSNGADTVWFILRTDVHALPVLRSPDRLADLRQRYPDWPGVATMGYLVWIKAESGKTYLATPTELSTVAPLTMLYDDETAVVYRIQSRSP